MKGRLNMLVGAVLFAAVAAYAADSCELDVPQPVVKEGSTWTYLYQGTTTELGKAPKTVSKFVNIGAKAVTDREIITWVEGGKDMRTDLSWNVYAEGAYTFAPKLVRYIFPLAKGAKIQAPVTIFGNGETVRASENYEVLGCEEVRVQAGTFNAVKIRIAGPYSATGSGTDSWSGERERILWFSLNVQREVKSAFRAHSPTTKVEFSYELMSYQVKK